MDALLEMARAALAEGGVEVRTKVIGSGCLRLEATTQEGGYLLGSPPMNLPLDPALALLLLVLQADRAASEQPAEWAARAFVAEVDRCQPLGDEALAAYSRDQQLHHALVQFLGEALFRDLSEIGADLIPFPKPSAGR